ncbi:MULTISPECIES: acyl carrier protein [unclassified Spirillospora]|uniref:acyl carrier protein n=1 Tax=unclassified Spirillospora TaxID=2642701 RepID=UPI0037159193
MPEVSDLAAVISQMVAEALGRPALPEENFFEAGMDSLALVEMHDRITERLGLEFPITELFANPNLAALLGFVGATAGRPDAPRRGDAAARRRRAPSSQRVRSRSRRGDAR